MKNWNKWIIDRVAIALSQIENKEISKIVHKDIDVEEQATIIPPISEVKFVFISIGTIVYVNNKLVTDLDSF